MAELEYTEIEVVDEPSKTYRLDFTNYKIQGKVDDLDAIKQAIYMRLSVKKYEHLIYSDDYGIELSDLFGEPESYVIPELQRRITEELVKDDRVNSVDTFSFESSKGSITTYFIVHTIFGKIKQELEVAV